MEKHCESKKRFGKEGNGGSCKGEVLEGFLRECGEGALRYAHRLTGNAQEAQEVVQEACYRALRAWSQYDASKPFGCWFYSIVRNAFIDSRRCAAWKRGVSLDRPLGSEEGECFADALADGDEGALCQLERREVGGLVRRALKGLNREQRAVLTLRDMAGWKYDDIARSLRIPVGTVRSRIFRAREALRSQSPELAAAAC